ncbi:MAG: hypothetical protein AAF596_08505 [Planctomycetota bacterium]
MRRTAAVLLLAAAMASTGCVAAVPLLIYAHNKNKHAAVVQPSQGKIAATPSANRVRVATYAPPALQQPEFVGR